MFTYEDPDYEIIHNVHEVRLDEPIEFFFYGRSFPDGTQVPCGAGGSMGAWCPADESYVSLSSTVSGWIRQKKKPLPLREGEVLF